MKRSLSENIFQIFLVLFFLVFSVTVLYPFLNILAISLNDGQDAALGGITIFPRKFTLINYLIVFSSNDILRAFIFSVIMTVTKTTVLLFFTSAGAYALMKKNLVFKSTIVTIFLIPSFISGGMIPYYLVIRNLHLMNNFLVYIIPALFDFYSAIIMRVFFQSNIPESLLESAYLDGASDFSVYFRIILPLSKPVLAAMALFMGVGAWNDWGTTMFYCSTTKSLWTLQFLLQRLVIASQAAMQLAQSAARNRLSADKQVQNLVTPQTITYATLMVATIPIVVIYPFLQKYFVSGLMLGSIKG